MKREFPVLYVRASVVIGTPIFGFITLIYQATVPDHLIIDAMNQQGGNLSESQAQQLLKVLTQERQQIIGQSGITQNLASMPPRASDVSSSAATTFAPADS